MVGCAELPLGRGGPRVKENAFGKVALTSISAAAAETATFPIDALKTRLQLQGRVLSRDGAATSASSNALRTRLRIVVGDKDGILTLYRGLSPAILRHLFYTPIRIVGYEHFRDLVGGGDSLLGRAITGGLSGVGAQVVASPADLVKVRMQADGHLVKQGIQPRYTGIVNAFRKIVQTEGLHGLWRGVIPNTQRAFLVNMGELACYDQAKRFIINNKICGDNIYAHTLASVASGLSAATLSCPADVIKTRMMNQVAGKGGEAIYRNSCDCLARTVEHEGLMALWKGFFPTWARLGPWQFVFWVSYEKLRQAAGLPSF